MGTDSKGAVLYAVQVGKQFIRVKSYGEFTLVDHPAKGTLFSREKDADARCEQVQNFAGHVETVELSRAVSRARVVVLRLFYEVVGGSS